MRKRRIADSARAARRPLVAARAARFTTHAFQLPARRGSARYLVPGCGAAVSRFGDARPQQRRRASAPGMARAGADLPAECACAGIRPARRSVDQRPRSWAWSLRADAGATGGPRIPRRSRASGRGAVRSAATATTIAGCVRSRRRARTAGAVCASRRARPIREVRPDGLTARFVAVPPSNRPPLPGWGTSPAIRICPAPMAT